jgi:hypothetical protein
MRRAVNLVEIEGSSSVKAAGFEDGAIRILFHSGHWKDFTGRTAAEFAELLEAPSKGRFVHQLDGRPVSNTTIALDTYENDPCCSKRLAKALRSNTLTGADKWICPTCGAEWTPELAPGIGRHWKPQAWAVVW